jgi:hypothetical protein
MRLVPVEASHLIPRTDDPQRADQAAVRSIPMLDVILLALGLGFFAVTVGYAYACDRL